MDVVLHELVASFQKLSGKDDDGCSTVTNLSILDLGELNQNLGGGVSDLELLEDGGAIVGDGHITDVVDKHLVKALGTEGRLDNVGQSQDGEDVLSAHILTSLTLTEDGNLGHSNYN